MVETARVQYIFLDVVGFTEKRSVEAQSDVIASINQVVTHALATSSVPSDDTILLPTGDGLGETH